VLTTANVRGPSANDVGPSRYVFSYSPKHEDRLFRLIEHEIGTNLLRRVKSSLEADPQLCALVRAAGHEPAGVIWRAFESLAEFYLEKLGQAKRQAWSGVAFDGQPYDFPVFFTVYDAEFAKDPKTRSSEMMSRGVVGYLKSRERKRR